MFKDIYPLLARVLDQIQNNKIARFIGGLIVFAFWTMMLLGFIAFLIEWIQSDQPLYNDIYEM